MQTLVQTAHGTFPIHSCLTVSPRTTGKAASKPKPKPQPGMRTIIAHDPTHEMMCDGFAFLTGGLLTMSNRQYMLFLDACVECETGRLQFGPIIVEWLPATSKGTPVKMSVGG